MKTEWNWSSNPRDPRHDEPYAAAFVAKTALEASDLVHGLELELPPHAVAALTVELARQ